MSSRASTGLALSLLTSLAVAASDSAQAQGLPTGGRVTAGSAQIGGAINGALTVQQSTPKAIVNWDTFSVGQQNSVVFRQPGASSAILNRVTASTPSTIAGNIRADGQVFLINPNGIAITSTGTVDTRGGFVASTLGITDNDFLAGRYRFTGSGASKPVTNAGTIRTGMGGFVALVGGSVANEGSISTPLGKVGLASGEAVTVDLFGDNFLSVAMPSGTTAADGTPLKSLISNSGKIRANGGRVEIKAATVREAFREAVNMSGSIKARSVGGRNGAIMLGGGAGGHVRVSGKINASARTRGTGGLIDISGADVSIAGSLAVSGGKGGTIAVNGSGRVAILGELNASGSNGTGGAIGVTAKQGADIGTSASLKASGSTDGGTIRIDGGADLTVAGRLAANGANFGGGIDLTATVTKLSAATVSATGGDRGGLVRIGGAFRGGKPQDADDPDVPVYVGRFGTLANIARADTTEMDASSTIDVSGGKTGGTAILWSNRDTSQLGRIIATGDVSGGAVEISAATLSQTNLASVRLGSGGRLLLDPVNMRVNTGNIRELPDESRIGATIEGQIREGASVTLEADNNIIWWNGTSLQNGPVSGLWAPAYGTLTLRAGGSMQFLDSGAPSTFDLSHHAGGAGGNLVIIVNNRDAPVSTAGIFSPIPGGGTPDTPGRDPRKSARFVSQGTTLNLGTGSLSITMDKGPADILFPYRSTANGGYGFTWNGEGPEVFPNTPVPSAGRLSIGWRSITAGSVVMRAYAADSGYVGTGLLRDDAVGYNNRPRIELSGTVTTSGAQSYTGALSVFTSSSVPEITLSGSTVTWTDEAFNTIRGGAFGGSNVIRFIENGTTTRYGRMSTDSADAAHLALGPAGNVQVYEGEPVDPLHVVRGALRTGDTPVAIAGGTVSVTYDQMPAVGNTVTATFSGPGFALSAGGYFVNMAQRSVQLTTLAGLIPLTYSVLSPTYEYFDPLTAVTLGGLVSGADVRPVVTINGTPLTLDSGAVAGQYLFAATHGIGTYNFTLAGITGADASKYRIILGSDVTGTLTINKILLAYTIDSVSSTYGNFDAAVTFRGVVDGVPIVPWAELTPNGGTASQKLLEPVAIGSTRFGFRRLNAGSYSFTGVELSTNADKYDLRPAAGSPTSGTIDIARKAISASVSPAVQYTYGPNSPTLIAFNGVESGDSVAVIVNLGGSLVTTNYSFFNDTGFLPERLAARPVTPFAIAGIDTNRSVGAQNYDVTFTSTTGTVTIDKRSLSYDTLKAGTQNVSSLTYGSSLANLTLGLGNIYSGDQVAPSANQILKDGNPVPNRTNGPVVGNYRVVAAGLSGADAANYALPTVDVSAGMQLAITQRPVTYTAVAGDYAYGQTSSSPIVTTDLLAGDDVRLPTLAQNCAPTCSGATSVYGVTTRVGSYLATAGDLAGADAGNYVLSGPIPGGQSSASINVTPKQLFVGNPDATYRPGEVPTQVVEPLSGLINGDNVSARILPSLGIGAGWNPGVGSYQILTELTGTGAANYTLNGPNARGGWTVTVTGGVLTYSLSNQTFTYGDSVADTIAALSGIVPADAASVHPIITLTDSNGQTQPLTARTLPGTYTAHATGLAFDSPAIAGGYTLDAAGALTSVVTVNQRPLTFTAGNVTTTYKTPVSLGTAVLSGILSGDDVRPMTRASGPGGSFASYTSSSAGTYTIGVSELLGNEASRYSIALTGNVLGTLTVNRALLTYRQDSLQKTYDDADILLAAPVLSGVIGNDPVSPSWGVYTPAGTGIATTNLPGVLFLGLPRRTAAGTYDLKVTGLTGLAAQNYDIAASGNAPGTLVIDRRPLFVPGVGTTTYGTKIGGNILVNLLAGDDVSLTGASIAANGVASTPAERTPVGDYALTIAGIAGSAAANYLLQNTSGQLNVQKKPINIDIPAVNSVYGTLPVLSAATTSDILLGDDLQVSTVLNRALDARMPAGTYALTASVTGTGLSNYFVPNPPSSNLTVNPKSITYALGTTQVVYGPTLQELPGASFSGILPGDSIPSHDVASFDSQGNRDSIARLRVGTHTQHVVLTGLSNYALDHVGSTPGSVTVTPRPVTLRLLIPGQPVDNDPLKVRYGTMGQNPTFQPALSGFIDGGLTATLILPDLPRSSSGNVQVGNYVIGATLGGFGSENYILANSSQTIQVVPRTARITYDRESPYYGDGLGVRVTPLGGAPWVVPGDQVAMSVMIDAGRGPEEPTARLAAGTYGWMGPRLSGTDARNYAATDTYVGTTYVVQKRLLQDFVSDASMVYGDTIPNFSATFLGVPVDGTNRRPVGILPGDDVVAGSFVRFRGTDANGGPIDEPLSGRLRAGEHSIRVGSLAGADAHNYQRAPFTFQQPAGNLVIAQRPITLTADDVHYVYGEHAEKSASVRLTGVLPGDNNVATQSGLQEEFLITPELIGRQNSHPVAAPFQVGTYPMAHQLQSTDFSFSSLNYVVDAASSRMGAVIISPKPITATLSTPSRIYGDTADLVVSLNGLHRYDGIHSSGFNDVDRFVSVSPNSHPVFAGGQFVHYYRDSLDGSLLGYVDDFHQVVGTPGGRPSSSIPENRALRVPSHPGMTAGDHVVNIQLRGERARNYVLVSPPLTLHVEPKVITWSVAANPNALYGGFTKACDAGGCSSRDGSSLGAVTFNGLAYGDQLSSVVNLFDGSGQVVPFNRDTPIGSYIQVVGEVAGSRLPNYTIASTGNTPSLLTVGKGIITYHTSDAVYLRGFGYLAPGPGGAAALRGIRPGDEGNVSVLVALMRSPGGDAVPNNPAQLPNGTYYYDVLALNADPEKYVLGNRTSRHFSEVGIPGLNLNRIGTLTVDDMSIFNQTFANLNVTAPPSPPPPPPEAVPIGALVSSLKANATTGFLLVDTTGGTGTQTHDVNTATVIGGAITARGAGAGASTSTNLGDAELTARATALAEALAKVGVTGIVAGAGAGAGVAVRVNIGDGFVELGAEAGAKAKIGFNVLSLNPGLSVDLSARIGAYVAGGAEGDLGGGATGSAVVRADGFALWRTDAEYGLSDGHLKLKTDLFVGTGASIGATTGVSGNAGAVSAGATLYSPGSLYTGFDPDVGYSDGRLKISLGFGTAIGIGGFKLTIGGEINFNEVANYGSRYGGMLGEGLATIFGFGGSSSSAPACTSFACTVGPKVTEALNSDRIGNINGVATALAAAERYLDQDRYNYTWTKQRIEAREAEIQDYNRLKGWYNSYNHELSNVNNAIDNQRGLVTKFIDSPASFSVGDYQALKASQSRIDRNIGILNQFIRDSGYALAVTPAGTGPTASVSIRRQ